MALVGGCAATSGTRLDDLGAGAYAMSKTARSDSVRPSDVKTELEQEALAYCQGRTGAVTIYDTKVVEAVPPALGSATVQFRCVKP